MGGLLDSPFAPEPKKLRRCCRSASIELLVHASDFFSQASQITLQLADNRPHTAKYGSDCDCSYGEYAYQFRRHKPFRLP